VECDEASVVAGQKGQPAAVQNKGRTGRRNRLQGQGGRGTLAQEKPPVCGMMQRCGHVVIRMLGNVKHKTIEPLIKETMAPGTLVSTEAYSM
jgi:transposase-like protein